MDVNKLIQQAGAASKQIRSDKSLQKIADSQGIDLSNPTGATQAVIKNAWARVKAYGEIEPAKSKSKDAKDANGGEDGDQQQLLMLMMMLMMQQSMGAMMAMFQRSQPQQGTGNPAAPQEPWPMELPNGLPPGGMPWNPDQINILS